MPRSIPLGSFALGRHNAFQSDAVTLIRFRLTRPAAVTIEVYDDLGETIACPVNGFYHAGEHEAVWFADAARSGRLFFRMEANRRTVGVGQAVVG